MALRTVSVGNASSGYTNYASLNAALAGEMGDLVSLDRQLLILCYNILDTTSVDVGSGWTVDSTHGVEIRAADAHGGKWSTSTYRLAPTSGSWTLLVRQPWFKLVGLQLDTLSTAAQSLYLFASATGEIELDRIIIRGVANSGDQRGLRVSSSGAYTVKMRNSLIYDFTGSTGGISYGIDIDNASAIGYVNDCTIADSDNPFTGLSTNWTLKCVVSAYNGGDIGTINTNSRNCVSTRVGDTPTGGSGHVNGQTITFVDRPGRDYHLAAGDTGARGRGLDLSADAGYAVSLDIDGATRVTPFDAGADEYEVVATPGLIWTQSHTGPGA